MTAARRRFDWALLLPSTITLPVDSVSVVGGDDDKADALIDAGVARRWRRADHSRGSDLAVVWSEAAADRAGAFVIAAHARVMVIELDRRRRRQRWITLRRLERDLRRTGHRIASTHIVSPDFDAPRRLLPIDDAAATRWHLRTLFVAATPATRAVRAALLALAHTPLFRWMAGAFAPHLLVIAARVDDGGNAGAPGSGPGDRAIVLTSGYDAGSRSIVLPFASGAAAPRHVVKVATGPESEEATAGEHERLRRLHDALPDDVARAVPLPLRELSIAGRGACVQTCAAGPSLRTLAGTWGRRSSVKGRELDRVVQWYNALGTATCVRRHRHDWANVFETAATLPSVDASTRGLLSTADAKAHSTGLVELAVHQHFDAGPWNIHLDRHAVGVVDWELDRRRPDDCLGPPLADVLYLVMYWYFLAQRITTVDGENEAVERLFITRMAPDSSVVAARRAIDAALRAHSLERQCVPPALVALWAERAVYTALRQQALGSSPGEATRPIGFLTCLAARSDELFTDDGWWVFPVGTEFANDDPSRPIRSTPAGG